MRRPLYWSALTLMIIGAVNWGLIGFFQYDLLSTLFGGVTSWISRTLYALIGVAGLCCLSFYGFLGEEREVIRRD